MKYEQRQSRAHSRACCKLPIPACIDLPAFLANLQHNGTPVSSKSLLPPQKQSLRGSWGRGGCLNIFFNKHLDLFSKLFLSFSVYL